LTAAWWAILIQSRRPAASVGLSFFALFEAENRSVQ
jgi:hypothetical protein